MSARVCHALRLVVATGAIALLPACGVALHSGPPLAPSDSGDSTLLVRLGERLFAETRLSVGGTLSCATCHQPTSVFAEARAVSHGVGRLSRIRNAPSLIDVRDRSLLNWDGSANSLQSQLTHVFAREGDMGWSIGEASSTLARDIEYQKLFRAATGSGVSSEGIEEALVAFQRTLVSSGSLFDNFYSGGNETALSADARRGWQLFRSPRSGCSGCHLAFPTPGSNRRTASFTDNGFHNLGVGFHNGIMSDPGRFRRTGKLADLGAFRTPSLRNVALTAPYMHNGSLWTLEAVVEFYSRGGIVNPQRDVVVTPRHFSENEVKWLVAFLEALTDTALAIR